MARYWAAVAAPNEWEAIGLKGRVLARCPASGDPDPAADGNGARFPAHILPRREQFWLPGRAVNDTKTEVSLALDVDGCGRIRGPMGGEAEGK